MYRFVFLRNKKNGFFALINVWALLLCSGISGLAQSTTSGLRSNPSFSIPSTQILGFPNVKRNCRGTLSTQDNLLRFQQSGKMVAEIDIASLRGVFLGEESMQVGGVPMKIGKAAAPYGGGRVVSLFAHKKYDTLTLEYVDGNGGIHGVIFQLNKGQGELAKNELMARGVPSHFGEDLTPNQNTSEVEREDK